MKELNEVNSSEWRLTIDEVRSCKGFENITDYEAENIIDTLVKLSIVAYESKSNLTED